MRYHIVITGALSHQKIRDLEDELGCTELEAGGIISYLWDEVAARYEDGNVSALWARTRRLARATRWHGDADRLASALVAVGLVDQTNDGLVIHGWIDVHGALFRERARWENRKEAQKKRSNTPRRHQTNSAETPDEHRENSASTPRSNNMPSASTPRALREHSAADVLDVPNESDESTVHTPSPEITSGKTSLPSDADDHSEPGMIAPVQEKMSRKKVSSELPFAEDFAAAWDVYPRKTAKKAAHLAYVARRRAGHSAADLLTAAQGYRAAVIRDGTEPQYVLHGSTFFGPKDRWQDYRDGVPVETVELKPEETRDVIRDLVQTWTGR